MVNRTDFLLAATGFLRIPAVLRKLLFLIVCPAAGVLAADVPANLPGELSADEVLNGGYPFPPSPPVQTGIDDHGLARDRLTKVPPPGVHPRILISPEDLPDLRRRLRETNVGIALYANLQKRLDETLRNPAKYWGGELYAKLAEGDSAGAAALIAAHQGLPPGIGHYQPFLMAIVLEAFDALISEDAGRGRRAATAVATYAEMVRPGIERSMDRPMNDDSWRVKTSGPQTGVQLSDQGLRDGVGGHLLGYAYDFAWPFMTEAQRATVRKTIAAATSGKLWMGARLPHHFRNWNWIAVGLQQPLLALAIEGEEGYDPRVYRLGVELARDYLNYGISPSGQSTEAVGYTQFGLVWANPFIVAAQRRGENLLGHTHHRAMLDWYLHATLPSRKGWLSQGDGGDRGPSVETLSMWRYFFPDDPKVAAIWRSVVHAQDGGVFDEKLHLVEPLLWAAADPELEMPLPENSADLAKLGLPPLLFDPIRSSLMARSGWRPDAAFVQFECRTDSVGASHEHADRGSFTFAALGRTWAKDNFRSVETRHHNSILIDGAGQGYWPGPGVWLGLEESGDLLIAACDAKPAYDWMWPKQILTENPDGFVRFRYPRWDTYRAEAEAFQKRMEGISAEPETRPAVLAFWQGYEKTDPRLWDEDARPVRYPHNPVRRAFRSIVFERGTAPFLLVIDDMQKDDSERLYEWLMQTGLDTEICALDGNDITLCDASVPRDADGRPRPRKGDRLLLVRILQVNDPALARDFSRRPSVRLETFERKDTLVPDSPGLSGSRSFGLDKRLVIASRSVAPDFKVLLFPFRMGDPLPVTEWNEDRTRLVIEAGGQRTALDLEKDSAGRTIVRRSETKRAE